MAQQLIHTPDLEKQRTAMKQLSYLSGTWSGEVRMLRSGEFVTLQQKEDVQYKLGGLVLVIEGTGRTLTDQTMVAQALGITAYDDQAEAYRIRAWVDGRMLESEVKLLDAGKGLRWVSVWERYAVIRN